MIAPVSPCVCVCVCVRVWHWQSEDQPDLHYIPYFGDDANAEVLAEVYSIQCVSHPCYCSDAVVCVPIAVHAITPPCVSGVFLCGGVCCCVLVCAAVFSCVWLCV